MRYKVLFFVDRMRVGGIQILLLNMQRNFDPSVIQCDYLVLDDGETYEYEDKFRELGANVYKLKGVWMNGIKDFPVYCKAMDAFFKEHHDYAAVHMHASSKNFMLLHYAKKYGIEKRIVHSHNTGFQTHSPLKTLAGNCFKFPMKRLATDFFACSELAGRWLFGDKAVEQGKVYVMLNGIELEKFEFNPETRKRVRNELKVKDNQIVIGNVGRFSAQKNHKFLLEIFSAIHKLDPTAVLLLAGIGELMEESKKQAQLLGISQSVRFLGFRSDVMELAQAMDVFLMPSFYEGFPVTGIEAQASGCPCVFSDTITREAALLDKTIYISLNETADDWAQKTLNTAKSKVDRGKSREILKNNGFDIKDTVKYLEKFYIS